MKQTPRRQHCAIYTRKSTEHNLDLAFNSLDAQREACEAYIKSQAHEGWTLVRDHFDDGGLSGASLDRPALQDLLNRVRAREIDTVVVYKVDRLTRSLTDFAKLIELFDAHDVSFVSVTQSFNTTSSMGRLTLNVLLSFAQFEREVIGERVRDKIAASKRKGIWVGGPVPLGYRSVNKKLELVPHEAELVRKLFADYLAAGSVKALAAKLHADGLTTRPRQDANSRTASRARFGVGALAHLLKNRFYVGEVVYRGEVHKGEHPPILDPSLFDAVQNQLREQTTAHKLAYHKSPHLLVGKIFDDQGHRMSPTHANKTGVRYRYYTSQALLQGRKADAGTVSRISAPDVEAIVIRELRLADKTEDGIERSERDLIEILLERVVIRPTEILIEVRSSARTAIADSTQDMTGQESAGPATIVAPFTPTLRPRKGIDQSPGEENAARAASRLDLLRAIARAQAWVDEIVADPNFDIATIATREDLGVTYVRRLATLAYLSPRIVEAIAAGRAPIDLTPTKLLQDLPVSWAEQERRYLPA